MATKVIKTTLRFKRGTAAEWTTVNPILKLGEPGYVTDLNKLKVGNGINRWNNLPYLTGSGNLLLGVEDETLEFAYTSTSSKDIDIDIELEIEKDKNEIICDGGGIIKKEEE